MRGVAENRHSAAFIGKEFDKIIESEFPFVA